MSSSDSWVIRFIARRLDRAWQRAADRAESRQLLRDPDFLESVRQWKAGEHVTRVALTRDEEPPRDG